MAEGDELTAELVIVAAGLNRIKLAEQQFRLACTVHLVVNGVQILDVPVEWSFGKHRPQ